MEVQIEHAGLREMAEINLVTLISQLGEHLTLQYVDYLCKSPGESFTPKERSQPFHKGLQVLTKMNVAQLVDAYGEQSTLNMIQMVLSNPDMITDANFCLDGVGKQKSLDGKET